MERRGCEKDKDKLFYLRNLLSLLKMTKLLQNRLGKVVNIQYILDLFFERVTLHLTKYILGANLRVKKKLHTKPKSKQQQNTKIG